MATFSRSSEAATLFRLDFRPLEGAGRSYKWEYSGMAEGRTGPSAREVADLRRANEPEGTTFTNQCLFIRTINHLLSDKIWKKLEATKFGTLKEEAEDSVEHDASFNSGKGKAKTTYATRGPVDLSTITMNQLTDSILNSSSVC